MKIIYYKINLIVMIAIILSACGLPQHDALREKQHLPSLGFIANVDQGNTLFHELCAYCHGVSAKGTGQGPPLIDKVYRQAYHSDQAIHLAVRDGVKQHHWDFGDMPPLADVSTEAVEHIIAYLRNEQSMVGTKQ